VIGVIARVVAGDSSPPRVIDLTVRGTATSEGIVRVIEILPAGVRVNCLVPGYLTTPMGGGGDAKMRDERRKATFLGTEGSGWDIAWAALFLAGPEARWITAQVLNVDAGSTAASNLPRLALFKD